MSEQNGLLGYGFEELVEICQKRRGWNTQLLSGVPTKPGATAEDIKLLEEYGLQGLRDRHYAGVIDRLKTAGVITL
jgi:hypothetical protein